MLLIKYATRGRRKLFFDTLQNIQDTIKTDNYLIYVTADLDDEEMKGVLSNKYTSINYSPAHSKVEAINRHLEFLKFDWLVNVSDDMHFIAQNWDEKMLDDIRTHWAYSWDFFAHFNDGFVGDKLPTMSVIGRQYLNRDGYIYHPSYKSVSCDAEAMYVAMMRGEYKYFDTVYFNHIHPANCSFISDKTYRDNDRHGNADTANYFERMAKGFEVKNPVIIPDEVKRRMAANG